MSPATSWRRRGVPSKQRCLCRRRMPAARMPLLLMPSKQRCVCVCGTTNACTSTSTRTCRCDGITMSLWLPFLVRFPLSTPLLDRRCSLHVRSRLTEECRHRSAFVVPLTSYGPLCAVAELDAALTALTALPAVSQLLAGVRHAWSTLQHQHMLARNQLSTDVGFTRVSLPCDRGACSTAAAAILAFRVHGLDSCRLCVGRC